MIELNLLTIKKKEQIRRERQYARARSYVTIFGTLFVLFVAVLVISQQILSVRLNALTDEVAATERRTEVEAEAPVTQLIHDLNLRLNAVNDIQQQYTDWGSFLAEFSNAVPDGIALSQLDIRKTSGKVDIRGTATTRDALVAFKDNLENSDLFTNIVSPISNLIQRTNIDFQFEATITTLDMKPSATQKDSSSNGPT